MSIQPTINASSPYGPNNNSRFEASGRPFVAHQVQVQNRILGGESMDFGAGDLLAVTKLAWDLYHNCFLAAKEAPDEFRQLVTELGSLQSVLKNLRDDVSSDGSFIDNLDSQRKDMLDRCLKSCYSTLEKLQKIVFKYREIGLGDGLQFWRRISWTTKRKEIIHMNARVMAHTLSISLCLSSIQNSSLARIEAKLLPALEKIESRPEDESVIQEEDEDRDGDVTNNTNNESDTIQTTMKHRKMPSMEPTDTEELSRRITETTLVERQPSSTEELDYPSPTSTSPRLRQSSMASPRERRSSSMASKKISPPRTSGDDDFRDTQANARKLLGQLPSKFVRPSPPAPLMEKKQEKPSVPEELESAMGSAMKELSKVKEQERAARPLRLPSRRNIPTPESWLISEFEADAEEEMQYRRLSTREWLRIATWWFLKAKYNLQSMEKPKTIGSVTSSSMQTQYNLSSTQGYVDLLKVSWILFDVVLAGDYQSSMRSDENRNILYNLTDGLAHEAKVFRNGVPDSESMQDHDISLDILEPMQSQEEKLGDDFGDAYNCRWVTAQQGDAGAHDEKVLCRTFVDAAFGGKGRSVFPKGAPYLLVLSTRERESEPKVTLCNQSGTLCLTRDFTIEDLEEFSYHANPMIDMDHYEDMQSLQLIFPGLETCVSFPTLIDLQRFIQLPKAYFAAVQRREPRRLPKASESLLYKSSVDIIEQLHPSTMKVMSKKHHFESCDIRILETTCKEGWRTTRRLVISSSASDKNPWCNEFFLPMDRVQMMSELPRQVTMKWSDCSQEDYDKTDGNYIKYFNHVYDDTRPNNALSLFFNREGDATEFQRTILNLSRPISLTWENGPTERGSIYEMVDTDPEPKKYKAIMLIKTRLDWTFSQIFYHYRDADFKLDSKTCRLHFPQLYYSNYCSNHYKEVYRPESTPVFSHCERRINPTTIDFLELNSAMAFLSALSHSTLVFVKQALHISTKAPSKLGGSTKSNKGAAEVFVWRQGNGAKVVSRWGDVVSDKWVSVEVEGGGLKHSSDNNRASVPQAKYQRGQMLDMGNLVAVKPKNKADGVKREGYLTWAFGSVKDQEDFVAAVEGRAPRPYKSALDEMDEYFSKLGSNVT